MYAFSDACMCMCLVMRVCVLLCVFSDVCMYCVDAGIYIYMFYFIFLTPCIRDICTLIRLSPQAAS